MSSTVTVDGSTDSYPVYGYDTSAASVMQYNHILTFAKGKTFTIKVPFL